jgi:hypothetical protein
MQVPQRSRRHTNRRAKWDRRATRRHYRPLLACSAKSSFVCAVLALLLAGCGGGRSGTITSDASRSHTRAASPSTTTAATTISPGRHSATWCLGRTGFDPSSYAPNLRAHAGQPDRSQSFPEAMILIKSQLRTRRPCELSQADCTGGSFVSVQPHSDNGFGVDVIRVTVRGIGGRAAGYRSDRVVRIPHDADPYLGGSALGRLRSGRYSIVARFGGDAQRLPGTLRNTQILPPGC